MKNFIKKNLVLVIGLSLPVLLIAFFFLATVLPKSLSVPPQYDMLFSINHYDYPACAECNDWKKDIRIDLVVRDGILKAHISKVDSKNQNYYATRLLSYDGKSESVREIQYDMAKLADSTDGAEITLDETRYMVIDTASKSPDGYIFEGQYYGGGGLVTELFGGGYRNHGYRIKKGAVGYKLPPFQNEYYYNNLKFIGWVVSKR